MRMLTAVAVAALLPAAAPAATFVVESGPLASSVTVNKFDGTLGTLTSVTGEITGQATFTYTFNQASVSNVNYNASTFFGLSFGPTFFDGTLSGSGTTNIVRNQATITLNGTATDVRVADAAIRNFFTYTGVGLTTLTSFVSVDLPVSSTFSPNGGGITNVVDNSRLGSIRITYTYDPFGGAVPEPATWAMMIAGFGLVGGAMRRRSLIAV